MHGRLYLSLIYSLPKARLDSKLILVITPLIKNPVQSVAARMCQVVHIYIAGKVTRNYGNGDL